MSACSLGVWIYRDLLALQESATGGAGEAAASAEAEAARLREANGSLQREIKESKQALSNLQSQMITTERSRDDEKVRFDRSFGELLGTGSSIYVLHNIYEICACVHLCWSTHYVVCPDWSG